MRIVITFLVCIALAPYLSTAQTSRSYRTDFKQLPRYWEWVDVFHDANVDRTYTGGALRYTKRTDNYNWSCYKMHCDPRKPWKASTRVAMHSGKPTFGPGLLFIAGDYNYYVTLGTAGNYWVGRSHTLSNTWITLNPYTDNAYSIPSEVIHRDGTANDLSMSFDGNTYRVEINGTTVQELPSSENWIPLQTSISYVGIVAAGITDASFYSFDFSYVEPAMPIVEDAFVGAQKQWVREFDVPRSRYPVISANGRLLFFIGNDAGGKDDAFVADALTDSTWSTCRPVGYPINNTGHNNVISVSQDGNRLFVYGTYSSNAEWLGGGFSTTRRTATGWAIPQSVVSFKDNGIASTREECLSTDESVLIASREIPGDTHGGKDLYVSFRQPDGSYGPITNLGPDINSSGLEGMPFIAADGRTLFFSSSHDSYGDDDIFVAKRLDDTWTKWSKRVNLGPTINTSGWDGYFCIHPSGRWAYMNSSDGYKSGIVRVSLPTDPTSRKLLPDPVMLVEGHVFDAKTHAPLSVNIAYANLETGVNIGTAISEPAKGAYSIILTGGRNYGFNAEESGYFPISENLDLDTLSQYRVIQRDLFLIPIEQGSVIRLNNLFFDTDKSDLRTESTSELARLVALLRKHPKMRIEISGHTDDRGSDTHNKTLSLNRATAVLTYLTKQGVADERLKAIGYGKSKPLNQASTDDARQQNRRVEFTVTSM